MERRAENAIWLAALLHDIGKFQQRAMWGSGITHQELGARWCEQPYFTEVFGSDLVEAVRQHHNPRFPHSSEERTRLFQLVQLADRLAAGERETEPRPAESPQQSLLVSILARIPLGWQEGSTDSYPTERRYPVQALNWESDSLLPQPNLNPSPDAYKQLWDDFENEWKAFTANRAYTEADFRTILALLEKYTSFIPSATPWEQEDERTVPDVSLYDHLRITSAIAACLDKQLLPDTLETAWQNPEAYTEPILLLVKGDISGIQSFLYLTGRGGVASGLKGRSAFLQLLTEAIAEFVLRELGLPPVCLPLASGGHFYLLAPHNQAEQLTRLRTEISQKLLTAFQGDLRALMEWVPLTTADLTSSDKISQKWDDLSQRLGQRKQQLWAELPDAALELLFTPVQRATDAESLCQVCYGEFVGGQIDDGVRKCGRCLSFEELGRQMRRPSALVVEVVDPTDPPENAKWNEALEAFGWRVHIVPEGQPDPRVPAPVVRVSFTPNRFIPSRREDGWSYTFRPLATATPAPIEHRLPDFEEIAGKATGAKWLGVLRMDVDSLGGLFARGLKPHATLSRMATLSRTMRLFFEGYVAHLCERYAKQQQVYLLYAGGDDLFVVGAWSVLPELAYEIRRAFRELVGADHITLSAGIAISHPNTPLYQLAKTALNALDEQAKGYERFHNGAKRTKDALSFLQTPMGWEEFEQVRALFQQVRDMVEGADGKPPVPRALISRLASIAALYRRNASHVRQLVRRGKLASQHEEDLTFYSRWLWQSVYHLMRFAERHKERREQIEAIRTQISDSHSGLIRHLHAVARWAELYTRGKEG
ncbi:MAG: type III-A CRISPR-associated protein Cas10/Csm1 [Fimbriimonadales bacterium]|nr:type III-A CRISPR-associated protein Cas10/Csm1 [Fimbriimonadales bacterium]GBC90714.1 CRISPR-associated protein Cas10/Csm1 [bacterium HR14]